MNSTFVKYGNLPISTASLALEFPNIKKTDQKIGLLERNGEIIRLKRGLYVLPEKVSGKSLSLELIANRLLTPSYVSMSYALRYYGLIPEAVYLVQSMTTKEARKFDTPVGCFSFHRMKKESFSIGVRTIEDDGYSFLIASPEKALCDLIAYTPSLSLRYLQEVRAYLEYDLRFDMEAFFKFNPQILEKYIMHNGKKANSIKTILKFLTHG